MRMASVRCCARRSRSSRARPDPTITSSFHSRGPRPWHKPATHRRTFRRRRSPRCSSSNLGSYPASIAGVFRARAVADWSVAAGTRYLRTLIGESSSRVRAIHVHGHEARELDRNPLIQGSVSGGLMVGESRAEASRAPGVAPVARLLCAAALCACSLYVFRGALSLYFAQEDFRGLAVATGILPRHDNLWRYVSVQTFMDVFYPLFRDHARGYHAVSLGLHALNAILLFSLLTGLLSIPAAFVGSMFFAVHPSLFTALYWQSARGDILAVTFGLTTLLLKGKAGRRRWFSIPIFALSLLSKESTLLLPAVAALLQWNRRSQRPDSERWKPDAVTLALFAESGLYAFYLFILRGAGNAVSFGPQSTYGFDFGSTFFGNLLTYVAWTVDLAMSAPGLRFMDRQNPALFPLGVALLVTVAVLSFWPGMKRGPWLIGVCGFFALLLPVLPLSHHAYHYYIYAALCGAALCVGALVDSLAQPREPAEKARPTSKPWPAGLTWAIALLCGATLAWNGTRLVDQMAHQRSPVYPILHADPIVDRSLIAERAIRSVRAATVPSGTHLVFILRERSALLARIAGGSSETPPPKSEVYTEANARVALLDGIGVRALVPAVDSVSFVTDLIRLAPKDRVAVYAPTGDLEVFDGGAMDSLLRSSWIRRW